MSTSSAEEYAESISEQIHAWDEAGAPFGWINDQTDEWTGDDPRIGLEDTDPQEYAYPWREASALDYLQDVLDIEYRVTSDRQYKSAEILIAFGGPNAWIDTKTHDLRVAWWGSPVGRLLPAAFIEGIDEACEELWENS